MSNYDAFTHLQRSLFLGANDLMSMLTVYCDDSGTDDKNRVAVVAGYMSNVSQWELFANDWMKVLNGFGIKVMRRSDLETFHGEFKKNWNPTRRAAFLEQLHSIIKRRTKMSIGSMVIKEEFEKFVPDHIKYQMGGVYGFLAYACLVSMGQWCNKSSRQHCHPINWVFEAGTRGHGQVDKMFEVTYKDDALRRKSRLGSWGFSGKEVIPLQSADVMAYECFKQIENQVVDRGERPIRISMLKLVGSEKYPYVRFYDKQTLEKLVSGWPEVP